MWLKLFDTASHVRVISGDLEDKCDLAIGLGAYAEPGDSFDLISMFLYTYPEIISLGPQ